MAPIPKKSTLGSYVSVSGGTDVALEADPYSLPNATNGGVVTIHWENRSFVGLHLLVRKLSTNDEHVALSKLNLPTKSIRIPGRPSVASASPAIGSSRVGDWGGVRPGFTDICALCEAGELEDEPESLIRPIVHIRVG